MLSRKRGRDASLRQPEVKQSLDETRALHTQRQQQQKDAGNKNDGDGGGSWKEWFHPERPTIKPLDLDRRKILKVMDVWEYDGPHMDTLHWFADAISSISKLSDSFFWAPGQLLRHDKRQTRAHHLTLCQVFGAV